MKFMLVLVITAVAEIAAVATVHYDKEASATIPKVKTTIKKAITSTPHALLNLTVTLSPSERKKRLLPYQNFYFNQPFNRPHQAGVSAQQYADFDRPAKRPNIEPSNFRPAEPSYQSGQKFTPFLESNALPGHFRPMTTSNQVGPQQVQYIFVDQHPPVQDQDVSTKDQTPPDLSAIYEKLAQLKLRQQAMQQKIPYGYRLEPHQRFRERPQKLEEFRPNYEIPRYKVQPSKTTFETFTATNIDIPDQSDEDKYREPPRYYHIPTPARTKYKENAKPLVHHQIAIELPPVVFSTGLARKPGSTFKDRLRQNLLVHQGQPKPLRKPKPVPVVEENYVAEKFVPYYQPHRPIYVHEQPQYQQQQQQQQYSTPGYENTYEAQYTATPLPPPVDHYEEDVQALHGQVGEEPSAPAYDSKQVYYQYHPVTPNPTTAAPAPYGPIRIAENLVPHYDDREEYRVTTQGAPLHDTRGHSLADLLKQLQESNTLPHNLTPDNIDNSIKTLVRILNALRDRQKQHKPVTVQNDYQYENEAGVDLEDDIIDTPDGGTPGKPGVDYPALSAIPKTTFSCKTQRYKGFFGDPDTNCQVWHYCDLNGGQASFLCPNGTIFSQVALTCDWWYNVKCASTAQLYVLNERLYKYIIPLSPKFPEDYSGPLVDKYLAMKFQEMEEKLRKQKKGKGNSDSKESDEEESTESGNEEEGSDDALKDESRVVQEKESSTTLRNELVETTTINIETG